MIKIVLLFIFAVNAVFPVRLYAEEELAGSSSAVTTIRLDMSKVRANYTGSKNPKAREHVPEFVLNRCTKESILMCMPGGKGDSFMIEVDWPKNNEPFSAKDKNGKSHSFSVDVTTSQTDIKKDYQKNKGKIDNILVELEDSRCVPEKMPKITLDYENNSCDFFNKKLYGKMNIQIISE